jgi:hypothetical protein
VRFTFSSSKRPGRPADLHPSRLNLVLLRPATFYGDFTITGRKWMTLAVIVDRELISSTMQ